MIMSLIYTVTSVIVRWFWCTVYGTVVHKLMARLLYFPSIGRMCLLEGPQRRWYDRIDKTVILGALPFRSQAKQLVEVEGVRTVISYNEEYELNFFTNSKKEWSALGVEQHWFPTLDFQPPALDDLCEGVRVVEGARALNHSVYVHCKAGKGRSATMVAAFLIKTQGFTLTEALAFIRERRPQISVNKRQQKRLAEYQLYLSKQE